MLKVEMSLVLGLEAWGRQVGKSASCLKKNSCIRNTIKTLIQPESSGGYDLEILVSYHLANRGRIERQIT